MAEFDYTAFYRKTTDWSHDPTLFAAIFLLEGGSSQSAQEK